MTPEQLDRKIQNAGCECIACSTELEGRLKIFEAFALRGDGATLDAIRHEIHSTADRLLDAKMSSSSLIRLKYGFGEEKGEEQ